MRGAVSIALAFNQFTVSGITWNPVEATMITSTIIVVLFSTMSIASFPDLYSRSKGFMVSWNSYPVITRLDSISGVFFRRDKDQMVMDKDGSCPTHPLAWSTAFVIGKGTGVEIPMEKSTPKDSRSNVSNC
eukprot:Gb_17163 [translate_table: standard]